jgi:hypothetical protein
MKPATELFQKPGQGGPANERPFEYMFGVYRYDEDCKAICRSQIETQPWLHCAVAMKRQDNGQYKFAYMVYVWDVRKVLYRFEASLSAQQAKDLRVKLRSSNLLQAKDNLAKVQGQPAIFDEYMTKIMGATEAYKFKNGKVVKSAHGIKPIVIEHTEYKYNHDYQAVDSGKVRVTVVAATQKMLYTDYGQGIRMEKAKLNGKPVTLDMLEFLEHGVKEQLLDAERHKQEPAKKQFMSMQEFRQMHITDENPEIAQDARNMTNREFYDKYKHIL